ncbi:STAS domain-containing protein [Aestuariispira ectoiniformans]|uniref:STAS domain-containing protein n=1 Tax=Aestuariispira ectoiniformans TaxID=2775080 RepID=UPI00223B0512|nr:STAS domain-containing protein [Aestuariispira ectoiniformans]
MNYLVSDAGDHTLCAIEGELTFNHQDSFRDMLDDVVARSAPDVVLDLSRIEFIDSSGMGMLLLAQERADETGKTVRVRGVHGQVQKMVELASLNEVLDIQ